MDDRTLFLKRITEAFGPPGLEDDVGHGAGSGLAGQRPW